MEIKKVKKPIKQSMKEFIENNSQLETSKQGYTLYCESNLPAGSYGLFNWVWASVKGPSLRGKSTTLSKTESYFKTVRDLRIEQDKFCKEASILHIQALF